MYRMQENGKSLSCGFVLRRDRALEQFVSDVLGQFTPNRCDRLSERQQERGDVIARARPLVLAFASSIDDLDRLDDLARFSLCTLRGRRNYSKNSAETDVPSSFSAARNAC